MLVYYYVIVWLYFILYAVHVIISMHFYYSFLRDFSLFYFKAFVIGFFRSQNINFCIISCRD